MARLVLILMVVLLVAACSGDSTAPEREKWISDVGEYTRDIESDGGSVRVYRFEGMRFYGDITLSDYRSIRARIDMELEDGEAYSIIRNYRQWPPALVRDEEIDVEVTTCSPSSDSCMFGRFWECTLIAGEVEVVRYGFWFV